jgi:hypothetical protein
MYFMHISYRSDTEIGLRRYSRLSFLVNLHDGEVVVGNIAACKRLAVGVGMTKLNGCNLSARQHCVLNSSQDGFTYVEGTFTNHLCLLDTRTEIASINATRRFRFTNEIILLPLDLLTLSFPLLQVFSLPRLLPDQPPLRMQRLPDFVY